jgi:hypothetical protein
MLTRYGFVHVLDTGSWFGSTVRLRKRITKKRSTAALDQSEARQPRTLRAQLVPLGLLVAWQIQIANTRPHRLHTRR